MNSPSNQILFPNAQAPLIPQGVPAKQMTIQDWRAPSRVYAGVNANLKKGVQPDDQSRTATVAALQNSQEWGVNLELEEHGRQFDRLYEYLDVLNSDRTKTPDYNSRLAAIVGASKADELAAASPARKRKEMLSAIVATEYGDKESWNQSPYIGELMRSTGAQNEEELISKYSEYGTKLKQHRQKVNDVGAKILEQYAQSGNIITALSSFDDPAQRELAASLVGTGYRQAALQTAYNRIKPFADRIKNVDENWANDSETSAIFELADELQGLDRDSLAAALELLPHMLPKDKNPWASQAITDTRLAMQSAFSIMLSDTSTDRDRRFVELTRRINDIRVDGRDNPDSWLGKGLRATVYQVPRIAAVAGTAMASAPLGPLAGYASAGVMGSFVYGSDSMTESYTTGSSKWASIGYGTSIGALEGAADMLAVGAGSLVSKGIVKATVKDAAGKVVQEVGGRGVGSFIKSGLYGATVEFGAESIADPLGILVEKTYRMMGADLTVQNTFRDWAASYDPTNPEFIVPILLLGGGLGAVGHQATPVIHDQTLRSEAACRALGIDESVANMPDSPEREAIIRKGLAENRLSPEYLAEASAPLFAMTADNLNMLRGAVNAPTFEPLSDGTVRVSDATGKTETLTAELASQILQTYVDTEGQEAFMAAHNRLAQKHVAQIAQQEGVSVNVKQQIDYLSSLGKSKGEARAMAHIVANPDLNEQFRSGDITIDEVMADLEIVALTQRATIDVADGKANIYNLVEEMAHARYDFDTETGKISEAFINNNLQKLQGYSGIDLGDLSDYTQNREAVARLATASATNPALLSNLPPAMESFGYWMHGTIAEVGRIVQEGELLSRAAKEGVIDTDFVSYLEGISDISQARENKLRADLTAQVTGETPLPAVRRRELPRIKSESIPTLEKLIADTMAAKPEATTRNIIKALERLNAAQTDNQSLRGKVALLKLLDNAIDLKKYGLSQKTLADAITAKTDARLETAVTKAVNDTLMGMYRSQRDIAAQKARAFGRKLAQKQKEWEKKQNKKQRNEYSDLWNSLLEGQAKDIDALKLLKKRQTKGRDTRSTTSDADSKRQILAAYALMEQSTESILQEKERLDLEYEQQFNLEETPETIEAMAEIENQINFLDTFGSALYREKTDKGINVYVKSADYINNALEKLKEIDKEGRARWKNRREERAAIFKELVDEAASVVPDFDQMTPIQKDAVVSQLKQEGNAITRWLSGNMSTPQMARLLQNLGYEKLGKYIEEASVAYNVGDLTAAKNRTDFMGETIVGAAQIAKNSKSIGKTYQYMSELVERNIDFAGTMHSKGQLIEIYMQSLNARGRDILIKNHGYTAEQLDSSINLIGEDGLYIANQLFQYYADQSEVIRVATENYTGHPIFFEEFYSPIEIQNESAGIAENMGMGMQAGMSKVGKPKNLNDRVSHNKRLVLHDNPFTPAVAYGQTMSCWINTIPVIELLNSVFTNKQFADSMIKGIGNSNYNALKKNLLGDVGAGSAAANRTAMAEVVGKAMSMRSIAYLGSSVISTCKSALSFFKPILMADISAIEMTKGIEIAAAGKAELSMQDILDLDIIKIRRVNNPANKTIYDMLVNAPKTGIAIADFITNVSMFGISYLDYYGICRSAYLAGCALQSRGLTGDALKAALASTVQMASQPEHVSTKPANAKHASKNEALFYQFMSEQINTFGGIVANWKGKNKMLAMQSMLAVALTEGTASILLTKLFGRDEDDTDLTWQSLGSTFLLAPLTSLPIVGGVASIIMDEAFGIKNFSSQRSIYDMDAAYKNIKKTMTMMTNEKDYSNKEWMEQLTMTARNVSLLAGTLSSVSQWEKAASIARAVAVSANTFRSVLRPAFKLTDGEKIDQLKLQASDKRTQIKFFGSEYGEQSPLAKAARHDLYVINKELARLRQNGGKKT